MTQPRKPVRDAFKWLGKLNLWQSFLKASLWIASAGLMAASSGLDGAYLSKLMPEHWAWLGLVLNTVADVTSELGIYWFGRLQQDVKAKRKRSWWILVGEVILVGYAWLFSWRQLVPIVARVDPDAPWMAMAGAAFIPAALIVVGYIQSLLAGRIENEPKAGQAEVVAEAVEPEPEPVTLEPATIDDMRRVVAQMNGQRAELTAAQLSDALAVEGLRFPSESTGNRWARDVRKGAR